MRKNLIRNKMERHLQENDIEQLKARDGQNFSYIYCQFATR